MPEQPRPEVDAVGGEDAADAEHTDPDGPDGPEQEKVVAPRWGARAVGAALVSVVAVVVGSQLLSAGDEQAGPKPTNGPDAGVSDPSGEPKQADVKPTGSEEPTGAALVFDAGSEGAVILDLDTGGTTRIRLPRGDASEQPYPLLRRGEWLVVAQHGGWALAPGGGPEDVDVRPLGDADFAVPAADPTQVWLVEEAEGLGGATWTLVEVTGEGLAQVSVGEDYTPIRGVPGGLAVRDEDGAVLVYWVVADGFRPLPEEGTRVLDATADRVVTCSDLCQTLEVSDERGQPLQRLGTPDVRGHGSGWLSPDGRLLAVSTSIDVDGGEAVGLEMRVYDVNEAELLDAGTLTLGDFAGSWTPDGERFFYRTTTAGPPAGLGQYTLGEGFRAEPFDVQDAPLGHFVALSRGSVAALLEDTADGDR